MKCVRQEKGFTRMRPALFLTMFLGLPCCLAWTQLAEKPGLAAPQASPAKPDAGDKPFGNAKRIAWTTSRVTGSPDPPPPYRVRRTFPQLKVANPISVAHEPGTDQLLLVHQLWPWVGPGRILRLKDGSPGNQTELLLGLDRTVYGLAFHPNYPKNGYLFVGSNGPVTTEDRDIPGRRFRPALPRRHASRASPWHALLPLLAIPGRKR